MDRDSLLAAARAARGKAYAPYSGFAVGAALLNEEDMLITGANVENASFGLTICAEKAAMVTAYHTGFKHFKKLALVADCSPPPLPCGSCRQFIWELAGDLEIVMSNLNNETITSSIGRLLPQPFNIPTPVNKNNCEQETASVETWRLPVNLTPIGYVSNDFNKSEDLPKEYKSLYSKVIIEPHLEEGLYRLEEEKEVYIISHLHQARSYQLKDKRRGRGNEVYGVFACRAPLRPNHLGQTRVKLVERHSNILTIKGADLINGTPVLDIKTVIGS